ncbi:porin family protein [bacterium]|nr:MAG: porin family protein [bacterium]
MDEQRRERGVPMRRGRPERQRRLEVRRHRPQDGGVREHQRAQERLVAVPRPLGHVGDGQRDGRHAPHVRTITGNFVFCLPMKNIALFAALFAAAPASAAGRAGVLSFSLEGGAAQPLGTAWVRQNTKLGPNYGGSLHYGLSDHFEGMLSFDSVRMFKTRQVRVDTALVSVAHYYDLDGGFSPAVRLGVGPAVVYNARPDRLPSHNTFAVRFGGGLDYKLCDRLSTGLWADYLVASKAVRETPEVSAVTFGLSLRWTGGEVQPRTPKTAKAEPKGDDREPGEPKAAAAPEPAPAPAVETPAPAPAPAPKPAPKTRTRTKRPAPAAPASTETPAAVQEVPGE